MDDLISRQAAIDALHMHLMYRMGTDSNKKRLDDWINSLPSAQPDVPDTNVGDCISRQAVVKFFNDWISCLDENCHHQSVADMIIIKNDFKNLPSAQPERKKGHWVEIGDEPYDEWECDVCGFVIDGSGCIDPEEYRDVYRFCPRCGSDMRGEQDE